MGKVIFDPLQKIIIEEFKKNSYLSDHFYFTGGTALSLFYFNHRYSEDLDFFTEEKFLHREVIEFINQAGQKYSFLSKMRQPEGLDFLIFSLDFSKKGTLKVDFNHYPYKSVEKRHIIDGLSIDSLRDIATNKLLTINQRTDVKDFVDLYFLLKEFTIWDLLYGVEAKFHMELDTLLVATDFLKSEEFISLPRMIKPLTLKELKQFFRQKAKEVGRRVVE